MGIKRLKSWFKKIKIRLKQHFQAKNLLGVLIGLLKISLSIGIDHIYFGTKNSKRFKLCILNYIFSWLVCLLHFSFVTSDYMYSLIKSPFLFDDFKVIIILIFLILIHTIILKTDILFGEINYNLSPLKIGYFIAKDLKSKHKLTEQNYNRLITVFRIWMIGLLYYAVPITALILIVIGSILFINTKQLI